MKSVLISIQPKWCELIASGKKTVEVRKTRPKLETPFKVYIYQTKKPVSVSFSGTGKHISEYDKTYYYNERSGKVIGEFVCDRITRFKIFEDDTVQFWNFAELEKSCLTYEQVVEYIGRNNFGFAWHISDLIIYDKPKELSHFLQYCEYDYDIDKCIGCKKTSYNDLGQECCDRRITRPPQSWCYVEGGGSDA